MKKVLFGITLILFAMLYLFTGLGNPIMRRDLLSAIIGLVGLVIAGIGAFTQDK